MHTYSLINYIIKFIELIDRIIPLNNYIKWNSWYICFIIANKHELLINIYIKKYDEDLLKNYLTS